MAAHGSDLSESSGRRSVAGVIKLRWIDLLCSDDVRYRSARGIDRRDAVFSTGDPLGSAKPLQTFASPCIHAYHLCAAGCSNQACRKLARANAEQIRGDGVDASMRQVRGVADLALLWCSIWRSGPSGWANAIFFQDGRDILPLGFMINCVGGLMAGAVDGLFRKTRRDGDREEFLRLNVVASCPESKCWAEEVSKGEAAGDVLDQLLIDPEWSEWFGKLPVHVVHK